MTQACDAGKARVVLLNPPTAAESTEILLSLAYLASALRERGHTVKVIDATAPYKNMSPEQTKRAILDFEPHFIGVTMTITYVPQTYAYLKELRRLGIPIVAGGSHVNPLPEEALARGVDIVALGEGEETVCELADYFAGNRTDLTGIKGLRWNNDDGTMHRTPDRPLIENLDSIPFPSFEDFPIRNYTGSDDVDSNPIFWAVFSSRGCPFNCTFCCGYNVFGRGYRLRSARNIFEEIRGLVGRFGVRKIAFQDDEILLSKERITQLCDLLAQHKIKIKMSLRSRIDSVEEALLRKMKTHGFRRMSFGVESWNDHTLKEVNKKYNVEGIGRGLAALDAAGFPHVNFNTIVGFPWETKKHLEENIRIMSSIPSSIKYFSVVVTPIPYPNTELYRRYHQEHGFTGWWLKSSMHCCEFPKDKPRPLFLCFARMITTLYIKDPFWNYSARQLRQIEDFSWKVFKLTMRRHLNIFDFAAVYALSRISHALWKISPALERAFSILTPRWFIRHFERQASFTKQE